MSSEIPREKCPRCKELLLYCTCHIPLCSKCRKSPDNCACDLTQKKVIHLGSDVTLTLTPAHVPNISFDPEIFAEGHTVDWDHSHGAIPPKLTLEIQAGGLTDRQIKKHVPTLLSWHRRLTREVKREFLKNEPWRSIIEADRRGDTPQAIVAILRDRWDKLLGYGKTRVVYDEMRAAGIGKERAERFAKDGAPLAEGVLEGKGPRPELIHFDQAFTGRALGTKIRRFKKEYGIEGCWPP